MTGLEHQLAEEDERTRYLIQVAQATSEHTVPFPLARITTCGTLAIEVLQTITTQTDGQPEAIYGPPDPGLLAKKGASTAFTLLALASPALLRRKTGSRRNSAIFPKKRTRKEKDSSAWITWSPGYGMCSFLLVPTNRGRNNCFGVGW